MAVKEKTEFSLFLRSVLLYSIIHNLFVQKQPLCWSACIIHQKVFCFCQWEKEWELSHEYMQPVDTDTFSSVYETLTSIPKNKRKWIISLLHSTCTHQGSFKFKHQERSLYNVLECWNWCTHFPREVSSWIAVATVRLPLTFIFISPLKLKSVLTHEVQPIFICHKASLTHFISI